VKYFLDNSYIATILEVYIAFQFCIPEILELIVTEYISQLLIQRFLMV